ncbi:dihydrodipicolinate reductase [Candidatus Blochmanniella vafra str. BVAF]|uniref:4-hydroxy-tetrahydrodipicolinate reductase n=1 Tax=Blochmanniella vafra (strain BVAF) TaxID=859654 RepID=E8Q5N2_BLOVB|nr:4-hydroxy-tetrahydrodipicolinate reductase [Candidatus Blochmannia vafer]ADV33529.1 dihydrodipicolinate reductase [Candidatus Blochmannia vafer str. BVAF]
MINNIPIRIAVTGITGRMGTEIIKYIIQRTSQEIRKKIVLGAAISSTKSEIFGMDVGNFIGSSNIGVYIANDVESVKKDFDVLIDFTSPVSTMKYLKFCILNNKNMVIGTTGFNKIDRRVIKDASENIGIVCSANFSLGITVMLKLLKDMSEKVIKNFINIDIIETHHNKKKDIPSGTALMIRNMLIKDQLINDLCRKISCYDNIQTNDQLDEQNKFSRHDTQEDNIMIHSVRAGDIVGDHSIWFTGIGERLEITHKAFDRVIFARGAVFSAVWLVEQSKIGLFDLNDVLELNM